MSSVNKVIMIGRLGKDPEIRTFQNGGCVASFSIATTETWKSKDSGERMEKTEWTSVSVTNYALVGIVERFVKKGSQVYIEGSLQSRKYQDSSGADKYVTEVVLKPFSGSLTLLDGKKDGNSEDKYESSRKAQAPSSFADDLDDDLTFAWLSALIVPMLALTGVA